MKIYKNRPEKPLLFLFFCCIGIGLLMIDRTTMHPAWTVIGIFACVISIFYVFPRWLSYSIRIDNEGISSLYILSTKVFKVRQSIKWADVAVVSVASTMGSVGIFPQKDGNYKLKDIIFISKNIRDYKELIDEVIMKAKNAQIDDSVKNFLTKK